MRRAAPSLRVLLASAALLALAATSPARAAQLPFTGTLSVQFGDLAFAADGSGVATVNGAGVAGGLLEQLALPAGAFAVSGFSTPVVGLSPISGVSVSAANAAGAFDRSAGALGGAMAVDGLARICLFLDCASGPPITLALPLGVVGVGGSTAVTGLVDVTLAGGPWSTGVVTAGGLARTGFARGPNGLAGSTAQPGGVVQLVTPVLIRASLGPQGLELPGFGVLSLRFVPEPGALALLGAGLVGLLARRTDRR
jgi:hypothetical protein